MHTSFCIAPLAIHWTKQSDLYFRHSRYTTNNDMDSAQKGSFRRTNCRSCGVNHRPSTSMSTLPARNVGSAPERTLVEFVPAGPPWIGRTLRHGRIASLTHRQWFLARCPAPATPAVRLEIQSSPATIARFPHLWSNILQSHVLRTSSGATRHTLHHFLKLPLGRIFTTIQGMSTRLIQ